MCPERGREGDLGLRCYSLQEGKRVVGSNRGFSRTFPVIASYLWLLYASLFMCHCIDLAPLILRNQDTSMLHFTIVLLGLDLVK